MNEQQPKTYADFVLPPSIVTGVDLSRLVTEMEKIDNELTTATIRAEAGAQQQVAPTASPRLIDFLNQNQIKLSTSAERTALIKQLRQLKDKAPVMHMTFAVEADAESLQKLAQWLRSSVHPQAVITVGLQPGLVAGVYLRTPNHVHDLSWRGLLEKGHGVIVQDLEALRGVS
jgi:hypothetical protein